MNQQEMEIDIWKGDWGLGSVDTNCLQIMALLKFSGVEVIINRTNNPFNSPNGQLPVFRHYKKILTSFHDVRLYLIDKNFCPDPDLNDRQRSEIVAYDALLKEKLYPALLYILWINNKNYSDIIRPWYSKVLPFPLNYYYPGHYQRKYTQLVYSLYPHLEESDIEKEVFKEAITCVQCISSRLGDSKFFYGDHPSSLDALVYGYLAPLLKIPVPCNRVQNIINCTPNLVKFVVHVAHLYFPNDYQEYESKRQKESEKNSNKSNITFPNKTLNQVLAGLFATVAMLSYGFWNGIFSISINTVDSYTDADIDIEERTSEE